MKKLALGAATAVALFSLSGCYEDWWFKKISKHRRKLEIAAVADQNGTETVKTQSLGNGRTDEAVSIEAGVEKVPEATVIAQTTNKTQAHIQTLNTGKPTGKEALSILSKGEEDESSVNYSSEKEEDDEFFDSSPEASDDDDELEYAQEPTAQEEVDLPEEFLQAQLTIENLETIKKALVTINYALSSLSNETKGKCQMTQKIIKENPAWLDEKITPVIDQFLPTNGQIYTMEILTGMKPGQVDKQEKSKVDFYISNLLVKISFELQAPANI